MPAPVNAWAVFEKDKISLLSIAHDPETAKALFLGAMKTFLDGMCSKILACA
jgi:hypothetical protein